MTGQRYVTERMLNPLPNDKVCDETKLKAFADNKSNVARMTIALFDRAENNVGKGKNAGYQNFLHFLQCFPESSSLTFSQTNPGFYVSAM